MEVDKENVRKTRIPLPKNPLPALPKHLITEKKENFKSPSQDNITIRKPLKTLNNQINPEAGPSKENPPKIPRFLMSVNTRHVTLRRDNKDLSWQYNVFKDKPDEKDCSVISISDEESYPEVENHRYLVDKRKKNHLGEVASSVTPNFKACLEPNRLRNIKRSLKRPHSRELQGLSPVPKEDTLDDKVKRRLEFNDRLQDMLYTPDFWNKSYMKCLNRDYTVDIFNYLLAVETKPLGIPSTSSITRACIINWLMKVNGVNGKPSTIQAACWYLDSILATSSVQLDKLQLIAAVCFWIAQKIQSTPTPAAKLVKCSNKAFTPEMLLDAEKAVLNRLRFPPQPVVPQEYITYLSWYCDQNHGEEIEEAATFLCMCGLMVDKALCDELPSVIAVAAVGNALVLLKKNDLMSRLLMCHVYKTVEKKASSTKISYTCSILRRAVRTVSYPTYEYKMPLDHYSTAPGYIAQRIVAAANEYTLIDTRNIDRMN